jgi:hypothetical protein
MDEMIATPELSLGCTAFDQYILYKQKYVNTPLNLWIQLFQPHQLLTGV